jgi:hypothetical protein
MSSDQKQVLEAWLLAQIKALEADLLRVEHERARMDADLARYRASLTELAQIGPVIRADAMPAGAQAEDETFRAEMPTKGAFAGLELTDAIYEYLAMNKQMRSMKEIWAALEDAGFKVLSGHPTRAVSEALRKRAHRHNDVFRAGGRWGATKNFSNSYIKRITKRHAGMGGRSAEEHGTKTSEGVERRRAAGLPVGAPRKLDAAMVVKIRRLREQGMSIAAVCAEVGISTGLYQIYRKRMKVWKEGTLWPPPEPTREELALLDLQEAQSQSNHLRVVK